MKALKNSTISLLLLVLIGLSPWAAAETPPHNQRPPPRPTKAIHQFVMEMVKKHQFSKKRLTEIMNHAQYDPKVIHWITHPFEKKPWNFYHAFFLRPDRIEKGVQYWTKHQKILNEIQHRYGVPPSVITAIIGVESYFGKKLGTYNELNALTTLAFYYPKRAKFFKKELRYFLLLTRHEKLSPLNLRGSYAGALGIPQFMPSTYRHYGVDYAKKGYINLFDSHEDAIASIAYYLKRSGWHKGQPIATPAKLNAPAPKWLISRRAKPKYSIQQFRRHRIFPAVNKPNQLKAALIAMQNTDSTEYWLVFRNFYAIMKYNPRTTYALAVYQLSRAIKEGYQKK